MKEEWRAVVGYEGSYEVSSWGNARSLDRITEVDGVPYKRKGRPLKPGFTSDGYKLVVFCLNGEMKTLHLARLVAKHFIPNPENLEQIDHVDCDKGNNHISNLRWCSRRSNMDFAIQNKRFASLTRGNRILEWIDVYEIRKKRLEGGRLTEIAVEFGVGAGTISSITNGYNWLNPPDDNPVFQEMLISQLLEMQVSA